MDAQDNGMDNPFADTSYSLEWVATAMAAARQHIDRLQDPLHAADSADDYSGAPNDAA